MADPHDAEARRARVAALLSDPQTQVDLLRLKVNRPVRAGTDVEVASTLEEVVRELNRTREALHGALLHIAALYRQLPPRP